MLVPSTMTIALTYLPKILSHLCCFSAHQLPTTWPRNPSISRYLNPSSSEIGMTASTSCLPLLWIGRAQQEGQGHWNCVCTNHYIIGTGPESATRHTQYRSTDQSRQCSCGFEQRGVRDGTSRNSSQINELPRKTISNSAKVPQNGSLREC